MKCLEKNNSSKVKRRTHNTQRTQSKNLMPSFPARQAVLAKFFFRCADNFKNGRQHKKNGHELKICSSSSSLRLKCDHTKSIHTRRMPMFASNLYANQDNCLPQAQEHRCRHFKKLISNICVLFYVSYCYNYLTKPQ